MSTSEAADLVRHEGRVALVRVEVSHRLADGHCPLGEFRAAPGEESLVSALDDGGTRSIEVSS